MENKRQQRELKVYDYLNSIGIDYFRVDHETADTMEKCAEVEKKLGVGICKNLFLCTRNKSEFYLLMMPSHKPFKTKDVTHQIGCSRLSFASDEYMEKFLDIKPGAVSVMGLINDKENNVTLVVDKEIYESEYIGCHPCVCTSSLKIKSSDIFDKFLKSVNHKPIIVDLPYYE